MSIDLHLHTHHSDGTWSPTDLVNHAISVNMKHIAITDHDSVAGIGEARERASGQLEVIAGVEINTIYEHENGRQEDIHILGYFIDPDNAQLKQTLQRQQMARRLHVDQTIERLALSGINISIESVQSFAGIGSIGRAHITEAIVAAGGAADLTAAYEKFMTRGSSFYVPRQSVSPMEAIHAIDAAGGIASIAHPGKGDHIDLLILQLRQCGLRAIEAFHRIHSVHLIRHFIRLANRNAMLITGGSDCHGPYENYSATVGSISVPGELLDNMRRSVS